MLMLCVAAAQQKTVTAVAVSEHWQANGYSSGEIEIIHQGARSVLPARRADGAVRTLAIFGDHYLAVGQGQSTTVFDLTNPTAPRSQQQGLLEGVALKHDYHVASGTDGQQPSILFYASWEGPPAFSFPLKDALEIRQCQFSPATDEGHEERFVVVSLAPVARKDQAPPDKPEEKRIPVRFMVRMFDLVDRKEVAEFTKQAPDEIGRWSTSGNAYEALENEGILPRDEWTILRRFYLQMQAWEAARGTPDSK